MRVQIMSHNRELNLAFVTTHLKLAEKAKIIYAESPKYSISALVSDIGGSMSLILGLNLLDLFVFSGSMMLSMMLSIKIGLKKLKNSFSTFSFNCFPTFNK